MKVRDGGWIWVTALHSPRRGSADRMEVEVAIALTGAYDTARISMPVAQARRLVRQLERAIRRAEPKPASESVVD